MKHAKKYASLTHTQEKKGQKTEAKRVNMEFKRQRIQNSHYKYV